MLAHQNEDRCGATSNRSASPRITPLTSDHVHVQHRNLEDNGGGNYGNVSRSYSGEPALSNGMIYGHPRNGEESSSVGTVASQEVTAERTNKSTPSSQKQEIETNTETSLGVYRRASYNNNNNNNHKQSSFGSSCAYRKKAQEGAVYYPSKQNDVSHWQNMSNEIVHEQRGAQNLQQFGNRTDSPQSRLRKNENSSPREGICTGPRIQLRNDHQFNNTVRQEHYQTREASVGDAVSRLQSVSRRFIRDNGEFFN